MEEVDNSMYRLNLKTLPSPDAIRSVRWEQECDGVIFYDIDDPDEAAAVAECPVPAVICHHTADFDNCHRCSTDNFAGGDTVRPPSDGEGIWKTRLYQLLP